MTGKRKIGIRRGGGTMLLTFLVFTCLSASSHAVRCPDYLRSTEQFQAELNRNPDQARSADSHRQLSAHR